MNGELVKTLDYSGSSGSQLGEEREGGEGEGEKGEEGGKEGELLKGDCTYRLEQLAYLRSGDKGNTANIGSFQVRVQCMGPAYCHILTVYSIVEPL